MSISDCFQMEFRMAQRFVDAIVQPDKRSPDFATGVDHVLGSAKGKGKAAWEPESLEEIGDEQVQWYFEPLANPADEWRPFSPINYERYPINTGLPSALEVETAAQKLLNSGSRAAVTVQDVVNALRANVQHALSAPKLGLAEKVALVLAQKFQIGKNGALVRSPSRI
jgi:hypothetical protein